MDKSPLTIVRLEANNIKRLKAVEIVPNGNVVTITGRNDQGKTSILDAIEYALAGKESICERPIRDGQTRANVVLDLGDIVVERKWTAVGGSTITVKSNDGAPLRSPQSLLDELCNRISFDPLGFVRMESQKQLEILRKLVQLDFSALDAKKEKAYNERKDVNRDITTAKGKLASFPLDPSAPQEEVSVSELMADLKKIDDEAEHKLKEARATNEANERVHAVANDAINALSNNALLTGQKAAEIDNVSIQINELRGRLKSLESELESLKTLGNSLQKDVEEKSAKSDALVDLDEDVIRAEYSRKKTPIQDQIATADSINAKVRGNRRHKELAKEVHDKEAESDRLTREIEDVDSEKQKALKDAKFPLPNLSFDETGVLLNGVPFSQGSQARQLQAAVAIGLALNPRVKVVLIRDGSLLDDESLAAVQEMVTAAGGQMFIEIVNAKGNGCIVIEDGMVKE